MATLIRQRFLARSLVLFEAVVRAGGNASLENPLSSLMWKVPWVQALVLDLHLFEVDMDQCEYGAPSMKPTRFLVSHALFKRWRRQCRGDHPHVPLKGFVRDARGRKVFATKLTQVYPGQALSSGGGFCGPGRARNPASVHGLTPALANGLSVLNACGRNTDSARQLCLPRRPATSSKGVPRNRCCRSSASPVKRYSGRCRWYTRSRCRLSSTHSSSRTSSS